MTLMTTPLDWADEVLDAEVVTQLREIVRWMEHGEHLQVLFDGPGACFAAALVGQAAGRKVHRIDGKAAAKKPKDAILFIDRTAQRSSGDRAANQQTAYLLQRLEDFPGLVILATNLRSKLDEAFARRFQAVVRFTAPASSRARGASRSRRAGKQARSSPGRSKRRAASRPRT